MENCSNECHGLGNTVKPVNACKHWILTVKAEGRTWDDVHKRLVPVSKRFAGQLEEGEGGYKHFQIYVCLQTKQRLAQLKTHLWNDIHAEKCRNPKEAEEYCTKSVTRLEGPYKYPPEVGKYDHIKLPEKLYDWQVATLAMLNEQPDDRSIYWYWEPLGKTGKTTFAKFLVCKHNAIYVKGKRSDMLYAAAEADSNIIVIDLSRSDENDIPYNAIEDLKNGIFFSGKYESKMIVRNSPHVIVFANYLPDLSRLSQDRWKCEKIRLI